MVSFIKKFYTNGNTFYIAKGGWPGLEKQLKRIRFRRWILPSSGKSPKKMDEMLDAPDRSVVVFNTCHFHGGMDPGVEDWREIAKVMKVRLSFESSKNIQLIESVY